MSGRQEHERFFGVLALSLSAHVYLFIGLGFAPSLGEALRARAIEFEVIQPPQVAPQKVEEPPADPPPRVDPLPKLKAKPSPPAAPKEPSPPKEETPEPQEEPAPVDFAGVTLTSEGGDSSWSTAVGNGSAIQGPVVTPRKATKPPPNKAISNGASGDGKRVRAADLSRPPRQPGGLDALLTKYYPERAKSQGIEGHAVIKVRIKPDGRVADMSVVRESYADFGKACMESLKSTRWDPAQDRSGRTVAFDITYTCRFEVGY